MPKRNVAVIFGSRSAEHEVSIITAHQLISVLDKNKYEIIPIYITKDGDWLTGEKLLNINAFTKSLPTPVTFDKAYISPSPQDRCVVREKSGLFRSSKRLPIDVVFPVMHGPHGEDGTLQGLLELAGIPYVGAGVLGSAVGMDKIVMKAIFRENNLPTVNYIWCTTNEWKSKPMEIIKRIEDALNYPVFVKPANSGSSIGIKKAKNTEDLKLALDVASQYDRRIIVDEGVEDVIEVNCSVMGNYDLVTSVCEQPISTGELLSFDDKYTHEDGATSGMNGAERVIPAPISAELTNEIQELSKKAFRVLDCKGIARVDFLVDKRTEKPYVNEINTIPGSFSFYLWERAEIEFSQLADKLIELAIEVNKEKSQITYSYSSNLLNRLDMASIKMKKEVKGQED
ncbi:D-alanine--D-alanine ligase [Candidatus Poribacteria bacterium]|nr:D-alanine--D-alanine ligase [Candidatus Poribacteria bacterium]